MTDHVADGYGNEGDLLLETLNKVEFGVEFVFDHEKKTANAMLKAETTKFESSAAIVASPRLQVSLGSTLVMFRVQELVMNYSVTGVLASDEDNDEVGGCCDDDLGDDGDCGGGGDDESHEAKAETAVTSAVRALPDVAVVVEVGELDVADDEE